MGASWGAPEVTDTDKMNNQKLSSSFDDKNRSRSVSPEITKFEEPGMFVLLDEEILANREGRQFRRILRDIHPKAIDLPNVGLVILHQEDPKMEVEKSNGEMKSLTSFETQVKRLKDHNKAGNKETKSHMPNPFHLTQRQEDKLQNFEELPSVSSIMNFSTENKIVENKSSRGRPKKRNGSNSKHQPTKKGDNNSVYKRSTKNFQPAELGDHEKVNFLDTNSIACGLAKEESASNDQIETAAVFRPGERTRTSAVKPAIAIEWSNIEIKFRVVSEDFDNLYPLYDLYPAVDPQSPPCQEEMRKNARRKSF